MNNMDICCKQNNAHSEKMGKSSSLELPYNRIKLYLLKDEIFTTDTTMDCLTDYCSKNEIYLRFNIESLVAVAMAAKFGNLSLLESLTQELGFDILNRYDKKHFTPLHIACNETNGDIQLLAKGVRKLLELGANPNIGSVDGHTPLSTVALEENLPLIDLLIEHDGKVRPCISHIKYIIKGKGFFPAEPIVWSNINSTITANFTYLLKRANQDSGSEFSVFPEDIIRVITILFWNVNSEYTDEFKQKFTLQ